jgi:hypothetical protein
MPDATPAAAPQKPLIEELERSAQNIARLEEDERWLCAGLDVPVKATLAVGGAYREETRGDGGEWVFSADMVRATAQHA